MLYPLSYEGGDAFPQVTRSAQGYLVEGRVRFQPLACPFDQRAAVFRTSAHRQCGRGAASRTRWPRRSAVRARACSATKLEPGGRREAVVERVTHGAENRVSCARLVPRWSPSATPLGRTVSSPRPPSPRCSDRLCSSPDTDGLTSQGLRCQAVGSSSPAQVHRGTSRSGWRSALVSA
jgi:hypothetical protein